MSALGIGLAVLGLVLVALRAWSLGKVRISIPVFNMTVLKLCWAGNVDRARKLCSVAPGSPYCTGVRAALSALLDLGAAPDPLDAETTMKRAFEDEHARQYPKLTRSTPLLYLGAALLVSALILPIPAGVYGVVALGFVVGAWALWAGRDLAGAPQTFPRLANEIATGLPRPEKARPASQPAPDPDRAEKLARVAALKPASPSSPASPSAGSNCPRCSGDRVLAPNPVAMVGAAADARPVRAYVCKICGYTELYTDPAALT